MLASPPCVRYEDGDLIGVERPPGVPLRSGRRLGQHGLLEWLRTWKPEWSGLSFVPGGALDRSDGLLVLLKEGGRMPLTETVGEARGKALPQSHPSGARLWHPVRGRALHLSRLGSEGPRHRFLERSRYLIHDRLTAAYRILHGASDGWPGWYVDRYGDYLLSRSAAPLDVSRIRILGELANALKSRGVYHHVWDRQVRKRAPRDAGAQKVLGAAAAASFLVLENGVRFEIRIGEGYSIGLFLDQRENRRRFLTRHIAPGFSLPLGSDVSKRLLNTFAYTCGFSTVAALTGYRCTSIDLSQKYLLWGRRNFELNELDAQAHEFLAGDVFDWLRRLSKKGRCFDLIVVDPPTFSRSRSSGVFRAADGYGALIQRALKLLARPGILFASCNTRSMGAADFERTVTGAIRRSGRSIRRRYFESQPLDFLSSQREPPHLKSEWFAVE